CLPRQMYPPLRTGRGHALKNHSIAFNVSHFSSHDCSEKSLDWQLTECPPKEGMSASADVSTTADRSRTCSEKSLD
ncbi:MAG: hypothetical protein ACK50Y_11810, partial [Flavobacteriia bacterium]